MEPARTSHTRLVLAAAVVATALVAGTGGAVAGTVVTSAQIRNGTIQTVDLAARTRQDLAVVGGYRQVTRSVRLTGGDYGSDTFTLTCPSGTALISATADFLYHGAGSTRSVTYRTRAADVSYFFLDDSDNTLRATAVCGRVSTR